MLVPEPIRRDVLNTLAHMDKDMLDFRTDHTSHYANIKNVNDDIANLKSHVLDIQTQVAADHAGERLQILEGKVSSLANIVEASHGSGAKVDEPTDFSNKLADLDVGMENIQKNVTLCQDSIKTVELELHDGVSKTSIHLCSRSFPSAMS